MTVMPPMVEKLGELARTRADHVALQGAARSLTYAELERNGKQRSLSSSSSAPSASLSLSKQQHICLCITTLRCYKNETIPLCRGTHI